MPAQVVYSRSGVRDAWVCAALGGGIGAGLVFLSSFAPISGNVLWGTGAVILAVSLFLAWRHGTARVEVGDEGFVAFTRWGAKVFRWANVRDIHAVVLEHGSGRDAYVAPLSDEGLDLEEDRVIGLLVRGHGDSDITPVEVHENDAVLVVRQYWQRYLTGFSGPLFT